MYLLVICTSFKNCLFNSLAHLLTTLFLHLVFNFSALYIFWILIPYLMNGQQSFSLILWLSLHSGNYFIWYAEVFNLMQSHLLMLALLFWAVGVLCRKSLPMPVSSSVFLVLSCSRFKVSGLA
jgi:hypothetical protein